MGLANRAKKMTQEATSGSSTIDWEALENYIIETADLEEAETMVGIVSGIVDVGLQAEEDGQIEMGANETEESVLADFPDNYFKTIDGKKYKCFKRKPVWKLVLTVDFPQIMLDKGKFFGAEESDPRPLRLLLNGEFTLKGGVKVASRPIAVRDTKELGDWGLSPKNTFYKMARDAKIIKKGEVFPKERVEEVLGKAYQFSVQIFRKKGAEAGSKGFYTEYCKYVGAVSRGQSVPELDESCLHVVSFDGDNDADDIKQLRASVRNTIIRAEDYPDSELRRQLEELVPNTKEAFQKYLNMTGQSEDEDEDDEFNPEFGAEEQEEDPVSEEGIDLADTDDDECPFD